MPCPILSRWIGTATRIRRQDAAHPPPARPGSRFSPLAQAAIAAPANALSPRSAPITVTATGGEREGATCWAMRRHPPAPRAPSRQTALRYAPPRSSAPRSATAPQPSRPLRATGSSARAPRGPSRHAHAGRERQRDGATAVPPANDEPARADEQDRPARVGSAESVTMPALRDGRSRSEAQHLSLDQAVTDDHQAAPRGVGHRPAAGAATRPRLRARRHPLAPGLDSQHARDKSVGASCLFYGGCEARRRGRSPPREAPSSSPLSAGCSPFGRRVYMRHDPRCPSPPARRRARGDPYGCAVATLPITTWRRARAGGR